MRPERQLSWLAKLAYFSLPWLDCPWFPGDAYTRPFALVVVAAWVCLSPVQVIHGLQRCARRAEFWIFSLFVALTLLHSGRLVFAGSRELMHTYGESVSLQSSAVKAAVNVCAGYLFFFFVLSTATSASHWREISLIVRRSAFIVVGYAALQTAAIFGSGWAVAGVNAILPILNHRGSLAHGKAFGTMPEGSYLGDYFATLVLPLALAGLAGKTYDAGGGRIRDGFWNASLVVASVVVLFISSSRIGLIAALAVFCVAALILLTARLDVLARRWPIVGLAVLSLVAVCTAYQSKIQEVLSTFTHVSEWQEKNLISNTTRFANMTAAVEMVKEYPTGVGPGAYPFHYATFVPSWSLWDPEIEEYLKGVSAQLPNPKGLVPRIAAEWGLQGLALHLGFLMVLCTKSLRALLRTDSSGPRELAVASLFGLVAVNIGALSVDTFLLCHYYVVYGLASFIGEQSTTG